MFGCMSHGNLRMTVMTWYIVVNESCFAVADLLAGLASKR